MLKMRTLEVTVILRTLIMMLKPQMYALQFIKQSNFSPSENTNDHNETSEVYFVISDKLQNEIWFL